MENQNTQYVWHESRHGYSTWFVVIHMIRGSHLQAFLAPLSLGALWGGRRGFSFPPVPFPPAKIATWGLFASFALGTWGLTCLTDIVYFGTQITPLWRVNKHFRENGICYSNKSSSKKKHSGFVFTWPLSLSQFSFLHLTIFLFPERQPVLSYTSSSVSPWSPSNAPLTNHLTIIFLMHFLTSIMFCFSQFHFTIWSCFTPSNFTDISLNTQLLSQGAGIKNLCRSSFWDGSIFIFWRHFKQWTWGHCC